MRRWLIVPRIVGIALGVVWVERHAVLASVGRLVVEKDRPAPADLVVALTHESVLAAEEAARMAAGDIASRDRP